VLKIEAEEYDSANPDVSLYLKMLNTLSKIPTREIFRRKNPRYPEVGLARVLMLCCALH